MLAENLVKHEFDARFSELKERGSSFQMIETGSGQKYIKHMDLRIYCEKRDKYGNLCTSPPVGSMKAFKAVERDALKVKDAFSRIEKGDTITALFNLAPGEYTDCVEVDITAAYAHAAKKLGIISQETLELITSKEIDKQTRLQVIGSIAGVKHIQTFVGKKMISEVTATKPTRHLFFHISQMVGNVCASVMQQVPEVYFFWVDAIFCPKSVATLVKELFLKEGFLTKTDAINKIVCNERANGIDIEVHDADGMRPFKLPSYLKADFYNKYAEKQKEIFADIVKIAKGAVNTHEAKDQMLKTIVKAFGTTRISKIPFYRITDALDKAGIKPDFYFNVRTEIEQKLSVLDIDMQELDFCTAYQCATIIQHMNDYKARRHEEKENYSYNEKTGEVVNESTKIFLS